MSDKERCKSVSEVVSDMRSLGDKLVEGDPDFLRKHLNFGFFQDEGGRIICTDHSMLYMCGRLTHKRKFRGRRSGEEVTMKGPYEKVMREFKRRARRDAMMIGCPHRHDKCVFWNDVFQVCSAPDDTARFKRRTPCAVASDELVSQLESKEK